MPEKTEHSAIIDAYPALEKSVYAALETYSNVHRGSGHYSEATTRLYEQSRKIVLEYMGLSDAQYVVIFCTPARAGLLAGTTAPENFQIVRSSELGLPLAITALAIRKNFLPKGVPFQTGGGTTKLVSKKWVMWAGTPDRFEAGTPAIINVIAFARALQLVRQHGNDIFKNKTSEPFSAHDILHRDELEHLSGAELLQELKKTMTGNNTRVPDATGNCRFINLDNSASTLTFLPVWNAVRNTWRQPHSVQQEIISGVRSVCSAMLGAPEEQYDILFTSNTTESINIAARALNRSNDKDIQPAVLNTIIEHSSNELPWRMLPGYTHVRLGTDMNGIIDINEMEATLKSYNQDGQHGNRRIEIVTVSGASNVLGTCNHLPSISSIVHKYGALLMVDAAQLAAHRSIDMEVSGIDILALSAHKIYAPFGCGLLVSRKGTLRFEPEQLRQIQTSGEENVAGIAALGKAFVLLQRTGMEVIRQEEQLLTAKALRGLSEINNLTIYGIKDSASPEFDSKLGVIAFALKGKRPDYIAREIAVRSGIGLRYGCHCAHIIIKHILKISPFLEQFQRLIQILFPKFRFLGVIRLSIGAGNCEADIDTLVSVLHEICGTQKTTADGTINAGSLKKKLSQADIRDVLSKFAEHRLEHVFS